MAVEFGQSSIREWLLDTQERSTIEDVIRHGCVHGTISELIYYHDTSAFYQKYKEEIWQKLWDSYQDMYADVGDNIFHFIGGFKGAADVGSETQLHNLLAWWATEITCQEICMDWDDEERATA